MAMDDQYPDPETSEDVVFWEYVRSYKGSDRSPPVNLWAELQTRGWAPPDPENVAPHQLRSSLERFVLDLAWLHVYVDESDHLDDFELYEELVALVMSYDEDIFPDDPESAVSISLLGGLENQRDLFLKWYASDDEYEFFTTGLPQEMRPVRAVPPYRRDWLPTRPE